VWEEKKMSYFGTREDAKRDAMAGDKQLDDLMTTSPVGKGGGTDAGGAPMSGKNEFSSERTRPKTGGMSGVRREFPTEGVGSKSGV
jgi:hypothetical protein